MTTTLRHGTWPSPITPESLLTGQVRIEEVRMDGDATYWLEGRPGEGGRVVLVRHDESGVVDVLPAPWDVRSRVHEYGGGAYAAEAGTVVFSHVVDGRLHRLDRGATEPVPITPRGPSRYGGVVLRGEHVYAVREDHSRAPEPANEVVRLDLRGENTDGGTVLASGSDFVSRPAVSPDGSMIAWVAWDHPDMAWDTTRLLRASLGGAGVGAVDVVAAEGGVSLAQPTFGPDGALWFVSDATGWWTVRRDEGEGPVAVHGPRADHASPQWSLGVVDLAVIDADHALVHWWDEGTQRLGILDAGDGTTTVLGVEGVAFDSLQVGSGEVSFRRALADRPAEVVRGPIGGALSVLSSGGETMLEPDDVSVATSWSWTDSAGLAVHGFLYPPRRAGVTGPVDALPPLVVEVHGGPTARAEPAFAVSHHFWTTRGFAVLDVNYSGSTGHGREYRDRLRGRWGVLDIDDCVTGALSVADAGLADRARLAIRGGSAGGYAVLRAMTTSTAFAAGTSLFGVTDLVALASDTHKFESRYLDRLVAPWPEGEEVFRERSPVYHAERLHGELLLLQGEDDLVVPVGQAEAMAGAMRAAGREVELVIYPGEGHGFRQGVSIVDALTRELAFYVRALGLGPPDGSEPTA